MTGCGKKDTVSETETAETTAAAAAETTGNSFIITLYPDIAPITCENFENLVSQGFYNGLTFHRVVDGFMAQGGDPQGTGMGGSDQTITGEFIVNPNGGIDNKLKHTRGVVSMARSVEYNSASSQFFICYTDVPNLDGSYAAFGKVTEGMEVVDDFLKVERVKGSDGAISSPTKPIVMDSVQMIEDDADGHPRVQVTMNDFLN